MLSSAETIDVIAETLQTHKVPVVVLDPVWYICPSMTSVLTYAGYGLHQWISIATRKGS